jgi:copper chaperone CopZ
MIGKIRLATNGQILAMALAWLAACMAIDFTFNRHLWAGVSEPPPSSVPLSLRINHLCCTGCFDDVKKALAELPWLKDAPIKVRAGNLRTQEQAEVAGPAADYGGWLDIAVSDVSQIDFVAIDQALRSEGFVASQMQFGGPRHFRLEARVRHMCCGMCKDACERLPELARTRQGGRLRWLDSVSADRAGARVVFHARYQEPDARIDVTELLATMDEVGLPPSTLKVVVGGEEAPAPAAPRS